MVSDLSTRINNYIIEKKTKEEALDLVITIISFLFPYNVEKDISLDTIRARVIFAVRHISPSLSLSTSIDILLDGIEQ